MRLFNVRDATEPHTRLQLILEDLAQVLDALLTIRQGVEEWSSNTHSSRSEAHRLQDVRAPPDSPVDVDFHVLKHVRAEFVAFEQGQNGGLGGVERPASVVGKQDTLATVIERLLGVRSALYPFDDDWQSGSLSDPGYIIPAKSLVEVLAH